MHRPSPPNRTGGLTSFAVDSPAYGAPGRWVHEGSMRLTTRASAKEVAEVAVAPTGMGRPAIGPTTQPSALRKWHRRLCNASLVTRASPLRSVHTDALRPHAQACVARPSAFLASTHVAFRQSRAGLQLRHRGDPASPALDPFPPTALTAFIDTTSPHAFRRPARPSTELPA